MSGWTCSCFGVPFPNRSNSDSDELKVGDSLIEGAVENEGDEEECRRLLDDLC